MYYLQRGQVPHKRHTQFRKPDGGLYAEELFGVEGFSGRNSILYHLFGETRFGSRVAIDIGAVGSPSCETTR